MKKSINRLAAWIYRVTATEKFFVAVLALMAVQTAWLALSAYYPLPFDEFVHFGEIEVYARQWSPFIAEQPAHASIYGDITREPSFLYYYLMSFPYRLVNLFTDNQMVLVMAMRLLNAAFVVAGLYFFRKLLLVWGVSRRTISVAVLAFAATPILPFVAAHVNYDNLMFLLTPLFLLVATRIISEDKDLVRRILLFGFLGATAILVKRTFLPLAGIVLIYVLVVLWKRHGRRFFGLLRTSWRQTRKGPAFLVLCAGLVIATGLFVERYGGNVVNYGSVWPECHQIQPREVCAQWGPWRRDNIGILDSRPDEPPFGNPASYTHHWIIWIMQGFYGLFAHYAGAEPQPGDPFGRIGWRGWLPIPIVVGWIGLVTGLIALISQWKKLWRNPYLRFGLILTLGFIAAQWLFNYQTYLKLWRAVAIQARYTYPILIPLFALMITSVSWWINARFSKSAAIRAKAVLFTLFFFTYVWGGGIAGWIIRSPDSWHWQNSVVQTVNGAARNVLRYLVIQ